MHALRQSSRGRDVRCFLPAGICVIRLKSGFYIAVEIAPARRTDCLKFVVYCILDVVGAGTPCIECLPRGPAKCSLCGRGTVCFLLMLSAISRKIFCLSLCRPVPLFCLSRPLRVRLGVSCSPRPRPRLLLSPSVPYILPGQRAITNA